MPTIDLTVEKMHTAQVAIDDSAARFRIACCGRRFGKSVLSRRRLLRSVLSQRPVAYFAPTYKMLGEYWRETINEWLPVIRKINTQEKRLELVGGGVIDMWSLDEPNAARGRKYAHVAIDEAAAVPRLEEAWNEVLRPTLADYQGTADFYSTPKGRGFFHNIFQRGNDALYPDWAAWQMPTSCNPYIAPEEIEAARQELPERVFQQEYLAQFLEDAGGVFRGVAVQVDKGRTANEPPRPGVRYAIGVDLARVEDFTVISVIDNNGRQVYFERFNQISWERQIAAIRGVAAQYHGDMVMDSTGVGDPIYEQCRKAGLRVTPFRFTSQSKEALIDNLAMAIEQGRIELMDIPTQTGELEAYQYELTASRNVRMNAPSGMHDDCVIALALAAWGAKSKDNRLITF